jgi:DNA-binding Lrp family transcriptional regulator
VKRLEKAGLIKRYVAVVDLRRIADSMSVLLLIYLRESDYKVAKALEEHLLNLPQLSGLCDVNGECDYIARFVCRGTEEYSQLMRELLDTPQFQVRQISSYIVLRQLRDFGGVNLGHLLTPPST